MSNTKTALEGTIRLTVAQANKVRDHLIAAQRSAQEASTLIERGMVHLTEKQQMKALEGDDPTCQLQAVLDILQDVLDDCSPDTDTITIVRPKRARK